MSFDPNPPRPVRHPLMFQDWENLTFLHWPCDPGAIAARLPAGLEVDTFDGTAWIGLTPFRIARLHAPSLPPLPWLSRFPETNLRTYVRGPGGAPGIWFFSLDADRLLAVLGAHVSYGLPYRWADMRVSVSGGVAEYRSRRHAPWAPARCRARIRIGEPITAADRENFLTARFRLYTTHFGKLTFADVDHEPWPLRVATVLELEQTLVAAAGVTVAQREPLAHFSPAVHVRIGAPATP
jgi:uncharacterized protein YqjF (DUF2071 family)